MLSDGEYLTNLDCELEQPRRIPIGFWREFTAFEKCGGALMRYFNGELESFSDIPLSPKGTRISTSDLGSIASNSLWKNSELWWISRKH